MWARRCFFGFHNEKPSIHWAQPEDADRAIASLNAIALGVEADVKFKWRELRVGSIGAFGAIGVSRSIQQELYIEFRVRLPYFNATQSAYRWSLSGGRNEPLYNTEVIALMEAEFGAVPDFIDAWRFQKKFSGHGTHHQADDAAKNTTLRESSIRVTLKGSKEMEVKTIEASFTLEKQGQRSEVNHATLHLSYWPDHNSPDGYVEILIAGTL